MSYPLPGTYRNDLTLLREAVARVENCGDNMVIDEATWLLGMFKDALPVADILSDCPKMLALLPEMTAKDRVTRMLSASDWMHRPGPLGDLATRLCRMRV